MFVTVRESMTVAEVPRPLEYACWRGPRRIHVSIETQAIGVTTTFGGLGMGETVTYRFDGGQARVASIALRTDPSRMVLLADSGAEIAVVDLPDDSGVARTLALQSAALWGASVDVLSGIPAHEKRIGAPLSVRVHITRRSSTFIAREEQLADGRMRRLSEPYEYSAEGEGTLSVSQDDFVISGAERVEISSDAPANGLAPPGVVPWSDVRNCSLALPWPNFSLDYYRHGDLHHIELTPRDGYIGAFAVAAQLALRVIQAREPSRVEKGWASLPVVALERVAAFPSDVEQEQGAPFRVAAHVEAEPVLARYLCPIYANHDGRRMVWGNFLDDHTTLVRSAVLTQTHLYFQCAMSMTLARLSLSDLRDRNITPTHAEWIFGRSTKLWFADPYSKAYVAFLNVLENGP